MAVVWGGTNGDSVMADQQREPWHIKREVQLVHILTSLGMLVSVVWTFAELRQDVKLVDERQRAQKEAATLASVDLKERLDRFQLQLDRIEDQQRQFLRSR